MSKRKDSFSVATHKMDNTSLVKISKELLSDNFIFQGPEKIEIKSSVQGQKNYCLLGSDCWKWSYGGDPITIDWHSLGISKNLTEILKAYFFHRLPRISPASVASIDLRWLTFLKNHPCKESFPWMSKIEVLAIARELSLINGSEFYGFKAFYKFGVAHNIKGFDRSLIPVFEEIRFTGYNSQYEKVLLNEIKQLTAEDESIILQYLHEPIDPANYIQYRNNVILHLAFELAPRPIQIHSLSIEDFEGIVSEGTHEGYYSLWLPMAKKKSINDIEKRNRKITAALGVKIATLIKENHRICQDLTITPLFLNPKKIKRGRKENARLSTNDISVIICEELQSRGFHKGDGATLLRHHLAQSLADQGASAETIAEILGHNSTVAARAYIAATPEISTIKARALGKNKTYENIMKMLLTGEIIEKEDAPGERWIQGMVGSQYIGGIGSCGLPENTACPKNPVYACYTCRKFHPFRDGSHTDVKRNLQKQAQFFIDMAEKGMSLEHNRTFMQLEKTIEAVNNVINLLETERKI